MTKMRTFPYKLFVLTKGSITKDVGANWIKHLIVILGLFIASVLSLIMFANFEENAHVHVAGDALKYIEMSQRTFSPVENPFALRLLSPYLAKQISANTILDLNFSWIVLTLVASYATLLVFFNLLYGFFKLSFSKSLIFTLFLAYTYNYTLINYQNYWLVDPINNLMYMLALNFILREKLWLFCATIVAGFLNKEVVLFMLPLYPAYLLLNNRSINWRKVITAVVAVVLIAGAYLIFRRWAINEIVERHGDVYLILNKKKDAIEMLRFHFRYVKDQFSIFSVFSFLWVFFFYALYRTFRFCGWKNWFFVFSLYFIAVLFLSRFMATDADRIFAIMAPLVLIGSALLFEGREGNDDLQWLVVFLLVYAASNLKWFSQDIFLIANIGVLVAYNYFFAGSDMWATRRRSIALERLIGR